MKTKDWFEIVDDNLRDQRFAAAYLKECLEEGVEALLGALRDVARANGGVAGVAKTAEVWRESVYRALSGSGNPEFRTVDALVRALGLRITLAPQPDDAAEARELRGLGNGVEAGPGQADEPAVPHTRTTVARLLPPLADHRACPVRLGAPG